MAHPPPIPPVLSVEQTLELYRMEIDANTKLCRTIAQYYLIDQFVVFVLGFTTATELGCHFPWPIPVISLLIALVWLPQYIALANSARVTRRRMLALLDKDLDDLGNTILPIVVVVFLLLCMMIATTLACCYF